MRVLAVDPGGTTGFAYYEDGDFRAWAEPTPFAAIDTVNTYTANALDALCVERFTITGRTMQASRGGSNTAIEIIGAARWLANMQGVRFVEQGPSDAKSFASDEKLRRIGWYTPGPDHARDATRHLLLFLATTGAIDLSTLGATPEEL